MTDAIQTLYGNRVRQRVCGLCWNDDKLLMVNHTGLISGGFWAPPGGGVEFGESLEQSIKREFQEETGLLVTPGKFLFGCEFIQPPLHAIELFFEVLATGGTLKQGRDPELDIISSVEFLSLDKIHAMPEANVHGLFRLIKNREELGNLTGFLKV